MDEELVESDVPTVGERLRAAREEKGLSLDDIAAQTRIPRRHLESIEKADWGAAPAHRPAVPAAAPAAAAQGPVVLTATDAVWLQVSQKGGATLFSGTLQPGQTWTVPATTTAPLLKTGKPEALKVNVGNTVAPPVGPPA